MATRPSRAVSWFRSTSAAAWHVFRRHAGTVRVVAWLAAVACWVFGYLNGEPALYLPLGLVAACTLIGKAATHRE